MWGRERAHHLMPYPHSLRAFGQDRGRKLIQFESCKGRTGSGKETKPHWKVQRSSHLSTTASHQPWDTGTTETTALSAGVYGVAASIPEGLYLDRNLDDATQWGGQWWWRGGDHHFLSMFCMPGTGQLCVYQPV